MFLIINYFPKREACQKVKLLYKTNQTRKEQKSLHVQCKEFVVIFTLQLPLTTDMVEDVSQNSSLLEEAIKQS